ncbi:MAG TPA: prohibitin family protein [Nitrospiria bacterium]|nr:prohibitin family protein [Nitrospiria bacterium]
MGSLILLLVLLGAGLYVATLVQQGRPPQLPVKLIVAVILLLLVIGLATQSFKVVGAGERGVVFNTLEGGIQPRVLSEGLQFKLPFVEDIIPIDVRVQKSETDASAASKDLQVVRSRIALNFHIDPGKANVVYQNLGVEFKSRVIDPQVQESVKAVTAQYTAEELITKRSQVRDDIKEALTSRLRAFNIIVDEFNIVDFSFSDEFNKAIEAKQTAEQNALKAKRDLERIKIEAEQTVTKAKAEADAQRLQRETITPILLQLRAIEKWNGVLPQVTGGAMPFIDAKTMMQSAK